MHLLSTPCQLNISFACVCYCETEWLCDCGEQAINWFEVNFQFVDDCVSEYEEKVNARV